MSEVFVSPHAKTRWFQRHGRAKGWSAISSIEELAQDAWDRGLFRWTSTEGRVVKDFDGCRFVFTADRDPIRVLITFFPIEEHHP